MREGTGHLKKVTNIHGHSNNSFISLELVKYCSYSTSKFTRKKPKDKTISVCWSPPFNPIAKNIANGKYVTFLCFVLVLKYTLKIKHKGKKICRWVSSKYNHLYYLGAYYLLALKLYSYDMRQYWKMQSLNSWFSWTVYKI